KCAILSNLTIERQRYADLMPTSTQRARQRVHDIYQRARPLHRGSLRAAHQNSHSAFDVKITNLTKVNGCTRSLGSHKRNQLSLEAPVNPKSPCVHGEHTAIPLQL